MRVLMLTYELEGAGGSFVRAYSLAGGLMELGHEVTIWCARSDSAAVDRSLAAAGGIEVVGFPGILPRRLRHGGIDPVELLLRLLHIGRERCDIVHGFGHHPTVSWTARAARRLLGVPYVADWADLWCMEGIGGLRRGLSRAVLGRADNIGEPMAYTAADGLTVISSDLARRAQAFGVSSDRTHLCPVGANIDQIKPLDRDEMRSRHGLSPAIPLVCYLGFNCCDAALLGQSFVELARMQPDVTLLLIGSDIPELDAIIVDADLSARVIKTGVISLEHLGEYLACADVMLLPYLDQPLNRARYPNKLGDYMAAGRPTVTNPTGDLKDLVAATGAGLLAGENPKVFAEAVRSLLADPENANRLGRHARLAAESVSWRALASGLAGFYARIRDIVAMSSLR